MWFVKYRDSVSTFSILPVIGKNLDLLYYWTTAPCAPWLRLPVSGDMSNSSYGGPFCDIEAALSAALSAKPLGTYSVLLPVHHSAECEALWVEYRENISFAVGLPINELTAAAVKSRTRPLLRSRAAVSTPEELLIRENLGLVCSSHPFHSSDVHLELAGLRYIWGHERNNVNVLHYNADVVYYGDEALDWPSVIASLKILVNTPNSVVSIQNRYFR